MKYVAKIGDDEREFTFERHGDRLIARSGEQTFELDIVQVGEGEALSAIVDGVSYDIVTDVDGRDVTVQLRGERYSVQVEDERERAAAAVAGNRQGGRRELRAAMPGIVVDVRVAVGEQVEEGQTLVVLEAMKMQNPLSAEGDGTVTKVAVEAGQAVAAGALLVEIE
ncbi:MAG TPA: acetyl-CoA carboxylase biotin carboxyl carrier protein subunit [bacterium]|nr:acetyl-CoA carboxylase biotin carboxyl carrier protein subunit [bacterium]